jgi:hypothetical protein
MSKVINVELEEISDLSEFDEKINLGKFRII